MSDFARTMELQRLLYQAISDGLVPPGYGGAPPNPPFGEEGYSPTEPPPTEHKPAARHGEHQSGKRA